jgi:hypothetical protein
MSTVFTLRTGSQASMRYIFSILLITAFTFSYGQTPVRSVKAVRTTLPVKIDGDLGDEAWKQASVLNDFVEQRPNFGKKEDAKTRTEAYLLYDDNAVYVAAYCHELNKDSISTELVGRDVIGVNDFAGIMFDTYLDQINGVGFYVTALGEQYDCKYSLNNEDDSWSAVYQTATQIKSDGWIFEMRIPYSALRFSKETVQNWGINFVRRRTKTGQQFMWSPVDPNKFGLMNQAGKWEGIEDIKAPIRLSFSPYLSSYLNHTPQGSWNTSFNGGMDVKYGISKGFTLDMTLVPDFGQVQSDNQVLNLSPFEVRYNENRSFFTEGTELFNKGNLFYSRRIGGTPIHRNFTVEPGHNVIENPSETKLINATKISGRTAKGLGIGFFNAITKAQYATVENTSKEEYKIETNPLTNYNIVVLDQTMKNNSSLTLVNTNVMRNGHDYDANVTAVLWDLYDKKVNWNVWGKVGTSQLMGYQAPGKTLSGYNYELYLGKFRGAFNFEIHQMMADDKYQQNDLGYFTNNNYIDRGGYMWYKWMKPKGFYNNLQLNLGVNYIERFIPRTYQSFNVQLNVNSQFKNLWQARINMNLRPEQNDFYESRTGQLFKAPGSWMSGVFVRSNTAKKYFASASIYYRPVNKYDGSFTEINLSNNYRFNDRLNVGLSSYLLSGHNNAGFAYIDTVTSAVVFGLRNQSTVENILSVKYNFNIKMGITFRARHYWSRVHYTSFYNLNEKGLLDPISSAQINPDDNVNFFNIDMIYTWQFAPGSFINIAWKDAAETFDQQVNEHYYYNFNNTIRSPQEQSLSVKVIYYLDYLSLKKKR